MAGCRGGSRAGQSPGKGRPIGQALLLPAWESSKPAGHTPTLSRRAQQQGLEAKAGHQPQAESSECQGGLQESQTSAEPCEPERDKPGRGWPDPGKAQQ